MNAGARAQRLVLWASLAVVVLGIGLVRWRLLDVPLDRDEGEFAYAAQLLLDGVPPYRGAYNLKMPGTYGAYALILGALGQSTAAIHAGLLVVNALTTVMMFGLALRLYGPAAALVTAATFAVLTSSPVLLGHAAYAEHFVLLAVAPASIALLAAMHGDTTGWRRWAALASSGVLFGLAILFKQSGAGFVAAGLTFVVLTLPAASTMWARIRSAAVFAGAALVPVALVCGLLVAAGTFPIFWFWTAVYARHYGAPLARVPANLVIAADAIVPSCAVILVLCAVGLIALLRDGPGARRTFLVLLAAGAAIGTAAGWHFREHYFLFMVPPAALLTAGGIQFLAGMVPRGAPQLAVSITLAALAVAPPLYVSRAVLFHVPPADVPREVYGRHPFPETAALGRFIRDRSLPTDRVAVVGSEPQIYFYADRRAATGFLYTYALMERQPYASAMQRQMIAEIEAANPRYLVFVGANLSWLVRRDSDRTIFQWFHHYARRFRRVAVADIVSIHETVYRFGDDAVAYEPRSNVWLIVLERER